jgi:hypothetical protein
MVGLIQRLEAKGFGPFLLFCNPGRLILKNRLFFTWILALVLLIK